MNVDKRSFFSLPNEMQLVVMSYLTRDEREKVREVCNQFRILADDASFAPKRNKTHAWKIASSNLRFWKKALSNFDLITSLLTNKKRDLEELEKADFETRVKSLINVSSLSGVTLDFIPNRETAIEMKEKLKKEIKEIEDQLPNETREEINGNYSKANVRTKEAKSAVLQQQEFQLIMDLFGGKEAYEALPILDIGKRGSNTGYIDFIQPEMMTAPIMRGIDKSGRAFFVIRTRHEISGDVDCQAFFQRYPKDAGWSDGGYHIISCSGYFLDKGKVTNQATYDELRGLIQTRRKGKFILE